MCVAAVLPIVRRQLSASKGIHAGMLLVVACLLSLPCSSAGHLISALHVKFNAWLCITIMHATHVGITIDHEFLRNSR